MAKAVLGLLLEEQRASHFVYDYSSTYFRQGIAGEAEHKAELFSAIERESLLLIAARIEHELPHAIVSLFSRMSEPEAIAVFRQAFLTYLGGTLAWDSDEREAFRKDLAMYQRLAAREGRAMVRRPGTAQFGGAFVDRCAFLLDPSMLAQAREAAARFQVQLENCAGEALRAAFGRFRARPAPALRRMPNPAPESRPKPRSQPERKSVLRQPARPEPKPKLKPKLRTKAKAKPNPKLRAKPKRKPRPKSKPPKSKPKLKPRVTQKAKSTRIPRRAPGLGRKLVAMPRPKLRAKPRSKPKSSPKAMRKQRRVTQPAKWKRKSPARQPKTPPRTKSPQRAKPAKRPARSSRKPKRSRAKK